MNDATKKYKPVRLYAGSASMVDHHRKPFRLSRVEFLDELISRYSADLAETLAQEQRAILDARGGV